MPLLEALACGCTVVASNLEVLREVANDAAEYCGVGDVAGWVRTLDQVLATRLSPAARAQRVERAKEFSWARHCRTIDEAYRALAQSVGVRAS